MDINGGQLTQTNGNPYLPATSFTGPLVAGNILHSDGSGVLAGVGSTGTAGVANAGYAVMAQTVVITQATATVTTAIVIPAQSQITEIQIMVTTGFNNSSTLSVGSTAGATTTNTFGPAIANATIATAPALYKMSAQTFSAAEAANWDNVSNSTLQTGGAVDVQILVTNSATGAGVATLTVFYIQGINNAS